MMVEAGAKIAARGRDGRGDHVRPPLARADHRPPGAAPRAGRQAQAHAVHRARRPSRSLDVRRRGRGRPAVRRLRRRDHQPRRQAGRDGRDRRRQGRRAARSPTAGRRSSTRARRSSARQLHGITDDGRARRPTPARGGRARSSTGPATRCSSATTSASTSASSRPPSATGRRIEPGRYLDTLVLAREAYPDLDATSWPTWRASSSSRPSPTTARCPTPRRPPQLLIRLGDDLPGARQAPTRRPSPTSIRSLRNGGDQGRRRRGARRRARSRRASRKSLAGLLAQEGRPRAGAQRGHPHGRPRPGHDPARSRVEVGLLPRAHGSALFTRGETQALTVATLGPSSDVQRIDTISPEESKRYLHHYNMPPYSTGENKPMRGPGRREIGHGALAERALMPVLPAAGGVPVRHPPRQRVRHLQRLDLDGLDLRLDARADGRRRADQGTGRRRGDGPRRARATGSRS